MFNHTKALIRAAIIFSAAILTFLVELGSGAGFGIIGGLTGAALGPLNKKTCGWTSAR